MKSIKRYIDRIRPQFEEGGRLKPFRSVFEGMESFLFVSSATSKSGAAIHDSIDSKRIMSFVVIALVPALLFGMYNIGYQNYTAAGVDAPMLTMFAYGLLVMLPKIVVSYAVGLGIEFAVAQWKREEIQEGYLVTGLIVPMIMPVNCPLWMMAVAIVFAVIFAKEIFGGTGMNIFNVALVARAFLFISYPSQMSGDTVWVANDTVLGLGNKLPDAFTAATPLAAVGAGGESGVSLWNAVVGLIPGSIGETSVIAIAIGAVVLLATRIASWKTMLSVFAGGAIAAAIYKAAGVTAIPWYEHLILGGFCFGAVFMATDPVTSARTEGGKYVYGLLIGVLTVTVRALNPGYPEGMMFAILMMNMFAPAIDYCFVQSNVRRRMRRVSTQNNKPYED